MKNILKTILPLTLLGLATMAFVVLPKEEAEVLEVGQKAPTFTLQNAIDGEWHSFSPETIAGDPEVKGYTVVFTCNTCPVARMYEQRIIDLHKKLAPKGYPVVAIQPNYGTYQAGDGETDSMADMKKRAEQKNYPFVYLQDTKQEIFPQYGAKRTPEVFLLDEDFTLRYHGAIDDNQSNPEAATHQYVEEAVAALEQGKDPEITLTKAVGCSIKVKK
jgi:hypothetical protein